MKKLTTLQALVAARKILSDPARWCQGSYARNRAGEPINVRSKQAASFCALGALNKVMGFGWAGSAAINLLRDSSSLAIPDLNDGKGGYKKVLALYDKAIKRARAEEA